MALRVPPTPGEGRFASGDSEMRPTPPRLHAWPRRAQALGLALGLGLLACRASRQTTTTDARRAERLMAEPLVRQVAASFHEPASPGALPVYFQSGFRLVPEGEEATPRVREVLATLEVGRREPDHDGAIAELRALAAALGADALAEVGYTLWVEGEVHGGYLVRGWIYHASAVRLEPDPVPGGVP